jgi:hypothetical protein
MAGILLPVHQPGFLQKVSGRSLAWKWAEAISTVFDANCSNVGEIGLISLRADACIGIRFCTKRLNELRHFQRQIREQPRRQRRQFVLPGMHGCRHKKTASDQNASIAHGIPQTHGSRQARSIPSTINCT